MDTFTASSTDNQRKSEQAADDMAPSDRANHNVRPVLGKDLSDLAFKKALVFLGLLGLIVRLGFFVEHAHTPWFGVPILDEKYYDTVARMLMAGNDLHELHGFRPLLYPMFLAAMYKLGGSWGTDLALFVQHLLGVGTGLMVAVLGARLFRHRLSGVVGGALYLLAPVPLYFEGELLIEPVYVFLICLGLLLHFHAADKTGWKGVGLWLLGGATTSLASQARANILVFLMVYPLFAAWRWWHSRERAALLPLLGLVGAFGMMVLWGFVNLRQSYHLNLLPSQGGVNLYLGNRRGADGMFGKDVITSLSDLSFGDAGTRDGVAPKADGGISGERYQDLVEVWAMEEYEKATRAQGREPETDPMVVSRYWTHRTIEEIKAEPTAWLRLIAKKSWLMLWNAEVPNNKAFAFLQEEFIWLRVLPVRWVVLLVLTPVGIWAAGKSGNRNGLFILLVYAGIYSAANVAFFICDRYRYPVWPALAAFGCGGLMACVEMIRSRNLRALGCICASMAFMAALSLHNWFGAKLPNFAQDYHFRSVAWYEKGRFEEALNDINRSIELDPSNAAARHHEGNVFFALNRLEEARKALEQTLELIPGDSGVWNNLGATLDALGATEEALQAFRRATECKFPSQNAFLGMAFIQIRSGRLDDAAATLDRLSELQRTPRAAALATRSVLERRCNNVRQAEALEQQARALDTEMTAWAINRATTPPARD